MDYEKMYHELVNDVIEVSRDLRKVINKSNMKYYAGLLAEQKAMTKQEVVTLEKFEKKSVFEYEAHPEKKEK